MNNNNNRGIAFSLSRREEFVSIILVAIILAIGTNLVASYLESFTSIPKAYLFLIGMILILAPLAYLVVRLFSARYTNYSINASIIADPEKNRLTEIPEYEFSIDLSRTLKAVFLENEALKSAWESEPLIEKLEWKEEPIKSSENKEQDSHEVNHDNSEKEVEYFAVVRLEATDAEKPKKSEILLEEAIEFVILDMLSSHLAGYFNGYKDNDKIITEYTRQHVPRLLLDNRILSLLSTPLEDRAIFLKCNFSSKPPPGEIESIFGSDGSMYSRFNLILPTGTEVSRPSPGVLKLENDRIVLVLAIQYQGFTQNLPSGFAEGYLGKAHRELLARKIDINFSAKIKPQALFKSGGWNYHEWVDSFSNKLQEYASFEQFLENIGWRLVSTNLRATGSLFFRRPLAKTESPDKDDYAGYRLM